MKTPIRYAGGKSKAYKTITPLIPTDVKRVVSPFVGGGSLEVNEEIAPRTRGWIHIFPSFLHHQAHTVMKGTRFSLVGWIAGPPFK